MFALEPRGRAVRGPGRAWGAPRANTTAGHHGVSRRDPSAEARDWHSRQAAGGAVGTHCRAGAGVSRGREEKEAWPVRWKRELCVGSLT